MVTTNQVEAKKKGHAAKMPNRRYGYFRDDQIMFLVTHAGETVSDNLLDKLRTQVNDQLKILGGGFVELLPSKLSFPQINDQLSGERLNELKRREQLIAPDPTPSGYRPEPFQSAFSLLVCNLRDTPEDPLSLLTTITGLRKAFNGTEIVRTPTDPTGGGPVGVVPSAGGGEPPIVGSQTLAAEADSMKIEDLAPNWLMSVSSQGSGTGGPGGLPTPFNGRDETDRYEFEDFVKDLQKKGLYGTGTNVDVAILDTSPCLHDLVLAPKEHPNNRLIQDLLGPNGKLQPYPATYKQLQRMVNTSINRHDYKMTDHGLFAAGIIHSIVPDANIHLIEVLNQFGVGDLMSLAEGLQKAFELLKPGSGRRLVVNCSWMLNLPLCDDHCSAEDDDDPAKKDPEYDFEQAILKFVEDEKERATALWALCNSLFQAGAQVVAAAGNDWEWARKRKESKKTSQAKGTAGQAAQPSEERLNAPEARYPAGFVSVVGVGALPKNSKIGNTKKYRATTYSNLGDKPAGDGIMTLGGEEGENKGVLGLYLGEKFPIEITPEDPKPENYKRRFNLIERNPNTDEGKNCWAWWAGTSFATPLLTGTIAAVLSGPANPGDTQKAVRALYDTTTSPIIIQENGTEAGEDVMIVAQGD